MLVELAIDKFPLADGSYTSYAARPAEVAHVAAPCWRTSRQNCRRPVPANVEAQNADEINHFTGEEVEVEVEREVDLPFGSAPRTLPPTQLPRIPRSPRRASTEPRPSPRCHAPCARRSSSIASRRGATGSRRMNFRAARPRARAHARGDPEGDHRGRRALQPARRGSARRHGPVRVGQPPPLHHAEGAAATTSPGSPGVSARAHAAQLTDGHACDGLT